MPNVCKWWRKRKRDRQDLPGKGLDYYEDKANDVDFDESRVGDASDEEVASGEEEVEDDGTTSNSPWEMDEDESEEEYEDLHDDALDSRNPAYRLQQLSASSFLSLSAHIWSRESKRDRTRRFLCLENETERKEICSIVNGIRAGTTSIRICSRCGLDVVGLCCGDVFSAVVYDLYSQFKEIIERKAHEIIEIRDRVSVDPDYLHCTSKDFFRTLEYRQCVDECYVSLLLSTDGVALRGHKKCHYWPITLSLLNLTDASRTKLQNLIIFSVLEVESTPTTAMFNVMIGRLQSQLSSISVPREGLLFKPFITSVTADQPAKRALYGFAHESSANSCFYCEALGTRHKWEKGVDRASKGLGDTLDDIKTLSKGYRSPSVVTEIVYPFHAPIDFLHSVSEGIVSVLLKESAPLLFNWDARRNKSTLFNGLSTSFARLRSSFSFPRIAPVRRPLHQTSASEKDRIFLSCLLPLAFEHGDVHGAVAIVSVAVIVLTSVDESIGIETVEAACTALKLSLLNGSKTYFTTKLHELAFHFVEVTKLLGNQRTFSTHIFESFYFFLFGDFKKSINVAFTEACGERFILWKSVVNELHTRSQTNASCAAFMKTLSESYWLRRECSVKTTCPMSRSSLTSVMEAVLPPVCDIFSRIKAASYDAASSLHRYSRATQDDVLFVSGQNFTCMRFIFAFTDGGEVKAVGFPFLSHSFHECYRDLEQRINVLSVNDFKIPYSRLLANFRQSACVSHGVFGSDVIAIVASQIVGQGICVTHNGQMYCIRLTGLATHC